MFRKFGFLRVLFVPAAFAFTSGAAQAKSASRQPNRGMLGGPCSNYVNANALSWDQAFSENPYPPLSQGHAFRMML